MEPPRVVSSIESLPRREREIFE
ncbi:MAG: hypothetical protein QOE79_1714, partial [Sphingomonadales bacterium]|nr:hypothetical protein [Sphingomonadales bacterium]